MNLAELVAIDTHAHADVSCCQPKDPYFEPCERAARKLIEDYEELGFKDSVKPLILEQNAIQLLKPDQTK